MALTDEELMDELFYEESEDEEDLTEEQYSARMAAALERYNAQQQQQPHYATAGSRGHSKRRYSTHLPKKKDVGTVLDYIEYYNSGRMAQDTAERLYQNKKHGSIERQRDANFLKKGERQVKDTVRRSTSRKESPRVSQQKVLSTKAAVRVGERLWADSGVQKARIDQLKAEADTTVPTKWNSMAGGRRLTKEQIQELGERLYPKNTFDRRTKQHIEHHYATQPPCASTFHGYMSASVRKVVPSDRELADKGRLPPGPWRHTSWVPSGMLGVSARHDEADKQAITGMPPQPLNCAGTPRRDPTTQESVTKQSTAAARAKRRERKDDPDPHEAAAPWKYS